MKVFFIYRFSRCYPFPFFPYTWSNTSSSPSTSRRLLTSKRSCTLPSVRSIRLFHNAAFGSSTSETSTRPTTRYFICTSCGLFFNTFAWSLPTIDIISGTVMLLTSSRIAFQLSPSFGLPVGFPLCPGFHAFGGAFMRGLGFTAPLLLAVGILFSFVAVRPL